jgi:dihydrofolate reductase
MRQVRYGVAMSLDGYIAGPNGEADWIVMDPDMDFGEHMSRFDTLLIGRKTFTAMQAMGGGAGGGPGVRSFVISRTMQQADHPNTTIVMGGGAGGGPGVRSFVISRTMQQADHPNTTIVDDAVPFVTELKTQPGKDIWLWGGGELFHSLLGAGLVDGVDVGVFPVLLGAGIPLLPSPGPAPSWC